MDTFWTDLAGEVELPMTALPLRRETKRGQRKNRYLSLVSQSRDEPTCNVHDRPLTVEDLRPMVPRVRTEAISQELT